MCCTQYFVAHRFKQISSFYNIIISICFLIYVFITI